MLLQILICQLEVQASNEDLGFGILVNHLRWLLLWIPSLLIKIILGFHDNIRIWLVNMHQWIWWLHGVELLWLHRIKSLLLGSHLLTVIWILLTAHHTRATHTHRTILSLWLNKVVCTLHIDSLLVDKMTFIPV